MGSLPMKFKVLFILVTVSALVVLVWNVLKINWTQNLLLQVLIFGIIGIASESLPVALPKGGKVTVSYPIFLAELILFPLGVTLTVIPISYLAILGKFASKTPSFKRVFNASQCILSIAVAYKLLSLSKSSVIQINAKFLILYVIAAIIFMLLNVTIVSVALGAMQNKPSGLIWVSNFRWSVPNSLALIPLGFLLALLYKNWGALGLCMLFIPLLACRHAFQLYVDMRENYLSTVEALVQALEAKDPYTSGHSARVGKLVVAVAEEIKMSDEKTEFLKYAAVLHDVGKIGVTEAILNKEGKLLETEWEAIRNHPVMGHTIIKGIKFLYDIGNVVRHHHERYDGKGYPDGIIGEDIPFESRIIAVADTYDAITTDRSYRKGKSHDEAIEEIKRVAGSQLDPEIVKVFCKIITKEFINEKINEEICSKII